MDKVLAQFVLGVTGFAVAVVANGYATMVLWGWFIAPLFDLSIISFAEAIGLSVFITYSTQQSTALKPEFEIEFSKKLSIAVIRPFLVLAVGWLYLKLFF